MAARNPAALALIRKAAKVKIPAVRQAMLTRARRLQLRADIQGCEGCKRRELCGLPRPFVFDGPSPALLTVVVDGPTKEDSRPKGRPSSLYDPTTKPGQVLDRLLGSIGMNRADVYLHPATACPPHDREGKTYTKGDTMKVLMAEGVATAEDLAPNHCVDRYAARSIRIAGSRVVVCLGETALLAARAHRAFSDRATFERIRAFTPPLQAGITWVAGWSVEVAMGNSRAMAELSATFATVGELVAADATRFAMACFEGSTVVGARTYAEAVDGVFAALAPALKGLPPRHHRGKIWSLLDELAELCEATPATAHNAKYAVRILREYEAGELVFPDVGYLAKKSE